MLLVRATLVAALIPATAFAEAASSAGDVSYQVETSIASDYVARAQPQYAGHAPCSQNAATVKIDHLGDGALSFGVWNAVALDHYDAQPGTALELDAIVAYGFSAGPLALTTGLQSYMFPSHADGAPIDGAHEAFITAAWDNPYVVPSAQAWVEFVHQQGVYLTVGGSHDFHAGRWTLSPAVSVGAATYRKYLGAEVAAAPHFNDLTAGLSARVDLADGVYAALRGSYAYRGTPDELMPDPDMDFSERSTLVGVVALGIAR